MKRFSILSTLVLACWLGMLACGPWPRPHYYVFSAFNRTYMGNTFTERMLDYWRSYTGKTNLTQWDMMSLGNEQLENMSESQNVIVRTAYDRHDDEMLGYLHLLVGYMHACDDLAENKWSYPTPEQKRAAQESLRYINNRARTYEGSRLLAQHSLLVMRTFMMLGDNKSNLAYWQHYGDKLPASVYRDMMKGIYANALLRTGKRREACTIYADLNDMQSIKWVMRDQRNFNGILKEYNADPNSPTLTFLIQDFVNNAQETMTNSPENMQWIEATSVYSDQINQFIALADKAVHNKKCKSPALWQSAAGVLTYYLDSNNASKAMSMLESAMTMAGTQRMRDNARLCRLAIGTQKYEPTEKFDKWVTEEMKWLLATEAAENQQYGAANGTVDELGNHYTEVLSNIIYDQLVPSMLEQGYSNLAMQALMWMDGHNDNYQEGFRYEAATAFDHLTSAEALALRTHFAEPAHSNLERLLRDNNTALPDDDFFNDQIGTKLLREGQFDQAITYLERVPLDLMRQQGIARYMTRRTYNTPRWFKHQIVDYYDPRPDDDVNLPLSSNQKLDFCRDVVALKNHILLTSNTIERANDAYRLASLYYQASHLGDCWYLTRYSHSVNDSVEYKNEMDYVGETVKLLNEALNDAHGDFELTQQCLYALAFIPQGLPYGYWGAPYIESTWLENVGQYPAKTNAMTTLLQFYRQHPGQVAPYISHCDILQQFAKL